VLKTLSSDASTLTFDASDCDRDGDGDGGMRDSSSDDYDFAAQVSFILHLSFSVNFS